jgi:type IV fimbrial biogenesis protein FimT
MQSRRPPNRRPRAGFTLIELLTTVAIIAIMLALAIPSFREFNVNYRTSVQANDLLADLALARNEAVKYARLTVVRAESGNWNDGWIVGTDLNGDGNINGDEIVKRHGVAEQGFDIVGGDSVGNSAAQIQFGITGQLAAPGVSAEFAVCRPDNDLQKSRGIRIDGTGRAATQKVASNTGMVC